MLFLSTQACREGDVAALNLLLQNNNVKDVNKLSEDGLSPLHYAARNDHGQVVQMLIDYGAGEII